MQTILIVEDDARMQKVLKRLFESEGFLVDIASDGIEGLDRFQAVNPSLAVLDLMLPRMSGRDLCKRIKKSSPPRPSSFSAPSPRLPTKYFCSNWAPTTTSPSRSALASSSRAFR